MCGFPPFSCALKQFCKNNFTPPCIFAFRLLLYLSHMVEKT
jgi:hypothetical protein